MKPRSGRRGEPRARGVVVLRCAGISAPEAVPVRYVQHDLLRSVGGRPAPAAQSAYTLQGTNTPTSTTITYHYGQRFQVTPPSAYQVGGIG
jgi:hypothetical protein